MNKYQSHKVKNVNETYNFFLLIYGWSANSVNYYDCWQIWCGSGVWYCIWFWVMILCMNGRKGTTLILLLLNPLILGTSLACLFYLKRFLLLQKQNIILILPAGWCERASADVSMTWWIKSYSHLHLPFCWLNPHFVCLHYDRNYFWNS